MYGLHNPEAILWGGTRRLKRYFHVVYGGGRRNYGGAGRNSLRIARSTFLHTFTQTISFRLMYRTLEQYFIDPYRIFVTDMLK